MKSFIKNIIKKELTKKFLNEEIGDEPPMDLDTPPLETGMQEILNKFPKVREILIDLLTPEFEKFVKDIYWVAPKPSTFKIVLNNEQYFFLTWYKITFIVQVSGKKYYLANLGEEEHAIKAINDLLKMGNPKKLKPLPSNPQDNNSNPIPSSPPLDKPKGDSIFDNIPPEEIPEV